ncbi:MAG TPA: Fe-S cluster assembly protein SufD [Rhodanobacteraceae bacterium]|nr:Fe-S cluster assembly protein SufD [Rhodanobacteraceae bacterium]
MVAPLLQAMFDGADGVLSTLPGAQLPWLDSWRRSELAALARDGLPDHHDEAWKYTALRALAQRRYVVGRGDGVDVDVDLAGIALPAHEGPRLVFVNGCFRADLSRLNRLPAGLEIDTLANALRRNPEPLRFVLARASEAPRDAFARLNAAFAADGMVLRVAPDARIEAPVELLLLGAPTAEPRAWHTRNLIELGDGAHLSVVERHAAVAANATLGTAVADIHVHANAELDWLLLQESSPDSVLMRRNHLRLDAAAVLRLHALELGGALVRHELSAELRGDAARLETRGAFMPTGRQHIDTWLDIRHAARDTASDALWRGIADQRGRGAFTGRITVDPGADGTDASLSNKNLLLSANAEIDTRPVLEIYADEVKAAHGATVGQLDERSLFYLQSRGIPLPEARRMLTAAFCRAVLESIHDPALRTLADGVLAARQLAS